MLLAPNEGVSRKVSLKPILGMYRLHAIVNFKGLDWTLQTTATKCYTPTWKVPIHVSTPTAWHIKVFKCFQVLRPSVAHSDWDSWICGQGITNKQTLATHWMKHQYFWVLTYQVLHPTTNRGHWKSTKQLHLIDTERAQFTLKLEGLNQSKSIKAKNKPSKNWATISDPLITPASPYVGSKLLGPEKTISLNLVKPVVVHHVSPCPSKNHHFCDHALGRKLNSFGPWAQYDLTYAWFEVVSRGPPVTCLFFPLDLMGTVGKETAETNKKTWFQRKVFQHRYQIVG